MVKLGQQNSYEYVVHFKDTVSCMVSYGQILNILNSITIYNSGYPCNDLFFDCKLADTHNALFTDFIQL